MQVHSYYFVSDISYTLLTFYTQRTDVLSISSYARRTLLYLCCVSHDCTTSKYCPSWLCDLVSVHCTAAVVTIRVRTAAIVARAPPGGVALFKSGTPQVAFKATIDENARCSD